MLNIWFRGCKLFNGKPINVVDAINFYFKYSVKDEWFDDPLIKEMIRDIDKSEVISPHIIESPVLGPILPEKLSGGVKTLMLLLKTDGFIYNLNHCGDNCAKWVLEIAKMKDLTVYLGYIMDFPGTFDIKILNTDEIVHEPVEYVDKMLEATELVFDGTLIRPNFV